MRSKPRRSLQDIRSMTDLVSETKNPQRKYLKLAVLEMEKTRRGKEAKSARDRMEDIRSRTVEIETEQADLLEMASCALREEAVDRPGRSAESGGKDRYGFVLKY